MIRPERFAHRLSEMNGEYGGKVVPAIKLAKAAIARVLGEGKVNGYHIESISLKAFRNYCGPLTHKAMLEHFFERASHIVKEPIRDSTGQSLHVDDYMGDAGSATRQAVSAVLRRIARRMRNANARGQASEWLQAMGE